MFRGAESFGEALNYFPNLQGYNLGPHGYLELIHKAKAAVSIPVIASLNGTSHGGWIGYARELAAVPDVVSVHVLPPGLGSKRDDSPLAYRDLRAAQRRIDRAYEASAAYLAGHL